MDDSVLAAIARWPNVPHVYGWLSLDRRGKWRLQDSPITNPHVTDFIARNYDVDVRGAWFFQNGPQRVYVRLAYTPWVLRVGDAQQLTTHTGIAVDTASTALLDEDGNLLIVFAQGIGLVEDRDLPALLEAIRTRDGIAADETSLARIMEGEQIPLSLLWNTLQLPIMPIRSEEVARRYKFVADPRADVPQS